MKIPLEFYDHIRGIVRVSDIVRLKVALTKKGGEHLGICPFHSEKTPSFTVNDAKRFYHCFGCSAHGDVIRFVSETSGISYKEAAIKIAGDNGIELPKISKAQEKQYEEVDYIHNILEQASQFFASSLDTNAKRYLEQRGLNEGVIKNFEIGYSLGGGVLENFFAKKSIPLKDLVKAGLMGRREDGKIYEIFHKRIMFPIRNIYNKVVGFGGRAMGDAMPKYINSPETIVFKKGEMMYGENIATSHSYKDNYYIVVEGYMDVIALNQHGFKHAVASLGTSVTEKHLQKLWRSSDQIIVCLDGDNAGLRASNRLVNIGLPHISPDKSLSFICLPSGLDPDDAVRSKDGSSFKDMLNKRISLSEMIWQNEFLAANNENALKTAESVASLEYKLAGYCTNIQDNALKVNFQRYFKGMIWDKVVRKKGKGGDGDVVNKKIGRTISKKYSELEFLEYAICSFLVKYPGVILEEDYKNSLVNLLLKNRTLNEFKDWMLHAADTQEPELDKVIKSNVKNTRFHDAYLVVSDADTLFLDVEFLDKNFKSLNEKEKFLEWLCKKHYFLTLRQEYEDILRENNDQAQARSVSYLKEIQKISKELRYLSDNFINN
ncbi:DNA primase [Rickettsiaceae bacterium]|nr:DNA primase [Rickettsiaceae bacterium]